MKHSSSVPICYFPTTVVLVDDSKRFLTNVSYKLDEQLAYLLYDDPEKALEYLKKGDTQNSLINKCLSLSPDIAYMPNQHAVNVDITAIHQEIYNPHRFNEVTVVVVDYSMPIINGVQFCEQLKDTRIKKIMVTGEADQIIAVQAFNAGIIDKFILKSDPDFEKVFNESIVELQNQFFQELTEKIVSVLAIDPDYILDDPNFITLFKEITKKHKVVEYFLLDASGSFLLLDENASPSWLMVKSPDELQMYQDLAEDTGASPSSLKQLKAREKIPYFHHEKDFLMLQGSKWDSYLYSAHKLQGKRDYYYALVKETMGSPVRSQDILSYENYLGTEWPPV
jgi:CheY-like chemotaxis protein